MAISKPSRFETSCMLVAVVAAFFCVTQSLCSEHQDPSCSSVCNTKEAAATAAGLSVGLKGTAASVVNPAGRASSVKEPTIIGTNAIGASSFQPRTFAVALHKPCLDYTDGSRHGYTDRVLAVRIRDSLMPSLRLGLRVEGL